MKIECYECTPAVPEDYSMYNHIVMWFMSYLSMDKGVNCVALSHPSTNGYAGVMKAHSPNSDAAKPYNRKLLEVLHADFPYNFNDEYDGFMADVCRGGTVPVHGRNLIVIQKGQIYKGVGVIRD